MTKLPDDLNDDQYSDLARAALVQKIIEYGDRRAQDALTGNIKPAKPCTHNDIYVDGSGYRFCAACGYELSPVSEPSLRAWDSEQ